MENLTTMFASLLPISHFLLRIWAELNLNVSVILSPVTKSDQRAIYSKSFASLLMIFFLITICGCDLVDAKTLSNSTKWSLTKPDPVRVVLEDINNKYIDDKGLIIQSNGDGGDTLNRMGQLYALLSLLNYETDLKGRPLLEGFRKDLQILKVSSGLYRRHWDSKKWYYNEKTTSRDQYTPIIIAAGLLGDEQTLKDIIDYLVAKKGYFPNIIGNFENPKPKVSPDFILPGTVGEFIRAGLSEDVKKLPVFGGYKLPAIDCGTLYMARVRSEIFVGKVNDVETDNGSDDVILTLSLLTGLKNHPTRNLRAAAYRYFSAKQKPIEKLAYYFRPNNYGPPLDKLYKLAIEKILEETSAFDPIEISQSDEQYCSENVSRMATFFGQAALDKKEICQGEYYATHTKKISGVNVNVTPKVVNLRFKTEIICKNSPRAIIKNEQKIIGHFDIAYDPSTCKVNKARALLTPYLFGKIKSSFPLDFRKEAKVEISKLCNPEQ